MAPSGGLDMNCSRRATAIRCASLLLGFIGVSCLLVPASHAADLLFVTKLVGSNEVPPSGSAGTGAAVVVINTVANSMSVGANFSGLGSGTTAAHIHCCLSFPFQPNNNVMVATTTPTFPGFPLGVTAGNYAMTFNLLNPASYNPAFITSAFNPSGTVAGANAALVSGIAAGETYFNVHTTNFPNGEIRGFLTPVSGEAVTGAQQGAFQIMTEFLTLMMDPFVYGRTGFGGAGAVYKEPALAPFEQRWTVWGGGYGAASRVGRGAARKGEAQAIAGHVCLNKRGYVEGLHLHGRIGGDGENRPAKMITGLGSSAIAVRIEVRRKFEPEHLTVRPHPVLRIAERGGEISGAEIGDAVQAYLEHVAVPAPQPLRDAPVGAAAAERKTH